jgi:RNA polymerase sigma factor (sigma-70 family)
MPVPKPWVERLIVQYTVGKKELEEYRETLDASNLDYEKNNEIIGGMISDMQYALDWMKIGRRPGARRGIDRQSVYQRTVLLDTEIFPSLQVETSEGELTEEEKRRVTDVLRTLSFRERHCFILNVSYGLSYNEIADEMKLSKASVQQYVIRARKKIKKFLA